MVLVAMASVPSARPLQPEPFYPQKNFPVEVKGYKEPSGAKQTGQYMDSPPGLNTQEQDRTGQPSGAKQTGTGQPTGTGSPPGLAWKLRLPLGMTRSQGPSQGPSATASTSVTGGQAARMASMATTRGAACPRRVSVDMTDKIVKMFLWARHDIHTALLAVLWTGSTGLGLAAASGHESAPIRWA